MPQIDEMTLKKHIKNEQFLPVYFLCGNETFLKEHYQKEIAKKACHSFLEFNLVKLEGKGLKIDELADAVEQLPVMSDKKCVVVCDYDAEGANVDELERLKMLLTDLPSYCILVFWFDSVEVQYMKPGKWRAAITAINKIGASVELNKRDTVTLAKMLSDSASKRGATLDINTARYMITVCGDSLQVLQNELSKLCYYKKNATILKEDIDTVAVKTIETTVFKLSDAITRNDADTAFSLLEVLFSEKVQPVAIIAAIGGSYVDIYRAKIAASVGVKTSEIVDVFGYKGKEFRLRNGGAIASRMTVKSIRKCIEALSNADIMLKSSPVNDRIIIEQTMMKLLLTNGE